MTRSDPDDTLLDNREALSAWPSASDRCDEWARLLDGTSTQSVGNGWECAGHGCVGWGLTGHSAQRAWLRLRRAAVRNSPLAGMGGG
jgi:hypothetical protein